MWCGAAALVFALFVNAVHLGYEIRDPGRRASSRAIRARGSRPSAGPYRALATAPPTKLVRLSREDQDTDEGLWHIRRRNESWQANDFAQPGARTGSSRRSSRRCSTRRRTRRPGQPLAAGSTGGCRAAASGRRADNVSHAEPYPVLAWPRGAFWLAAGLRAAPGAGRPRLGAAPRGPRRVAVDMKMPNHAAAAPSRYRDATPIRGGGSCARSAGPRPSASVARLRLSHAARRPAARQHQSADDGVHRAAGARGTRARQDAASGSSAGCRTAGSRRT